MYKIEDNYEKIFDSIITETSAYVEENGLKSFVLGLSGGVDSTVVCALARKVCDETNTRLIGVSLPTRFNKREEVENAELTCETFCDTSIYRSLDETASTLLADFDDLDFNRADLTPEEKVRRGNLTARLRMMYLYNKAHERDGIVLSTDNLTEYLLGFWTLHGDVGDFGMIQNLWKTEVYGLASFLYNMNITEGKLRRAKALRAAIGAIATDGLGISDSDLDQICAESYRITDEILIKYLNGDKSQENHPVIVRHKKSFFKRDNPYNIGREELLK